MSPVRRTSAGDGACASFGDRIAGMPCEGAPEALRGEHGVPGALVEAYRLPLGSSRSTPHRVTWQVACASARS
ncbi:hypothetical protein ACFY1U_32090 [Streptomyces sp. NPDC001351]|uniref:hypothetical protein n=1 Tax=Streptomyces sp. NPDC001351 TaxID=3364564 RepID=UPI0036BE5279